MFSLIITLISIALVVVLALAILYYGGTAFRQGKQAADAALIVNQGQQIAAAVDMFNSSKGRWPNDLDELVASSYLTSIPSGYAQIDTGFMPTALAADIGWTTPAATVPTYLMSAPISDALCQLVNSRVLGIAGIPSQAYSSPVSQCYYSATSGTNRVVVTRSGATLASALPVGDVAPVTAALPVAGVAAGWQVAPTTAPTTPVVVVPATPEAVGSISVASLDFASVTTGTTPITQSVVLSNTGNAPMTVSSATISAGAADFSVNSSCSVIAAGASCTLSVTFSPSSAGAHTGTLSVSHSGSGATSVALSGTGVAPAPTGVVIVDGTGAAGDFGTIASETSATRQFVVTNYGAAPAQINSALIANYSVVTANGTSCQPGLAMSAASTFFAAAGQALLPNALAGGFNPGPVLPPPPTGTFTGGPWVLAAGASCTFTVKATGDSSGAAFATTLDLSVKNAPTASVNLSGVSAVFPTGPFAVTNVVFYSVTQNSVVYPDGIIELTLRNDSINTLNEIDVNFSASYNFSQMPGLSIAPGQTYTHQFFRNYTGSYVKNPNLNFSAYGLVTGAAHTRAQVLNSPINEP